MMFDSAYSLHANWNNLALFYCSLLAVGLFECNAASQDAQTLLRVGHVDWINTSNALSSWKSDSKTPCGWKGITCNDLNVVTTVNLTKAWISGNLTSELCKLPSLTTLILQANHFGGPFPHGLLECKRLRVLDLSDNHFAGSLPNRIHQLGELRVLNLGHNGFSGRIPGELGNLKQLHKLYLNKCNLVGKIPDSLGNLTHLESLDLSENHLVGDIPANFTTLSELKVMDLWRNKLSGQIPSNIGRLKKLSELDFSENRLSGEIPESISNLTYLDWLNLSENQLVGGIPEQLGTLPRLRILVLFNNKLTGLLPRTLGAYSSISAVDFGGNKLEGHLPKDICRSKSLYTLVVSSNNFNGSLPSSLEDCPSLKYVVLSNNSFSGEIAVRVWSAPDLEWMYLSNNKFQGQIPAAIGQAKNLRFLEVSNNNFSGSIPAEIGKLQFLDRFIASNNRFSGSIPAELTCLSSLSNLQLDRNFLEGKIPNAIKSWINLIQLNLSNNRLTGEIPESLGALPSLNALDLSNNFLSGQIPEELGSMNLNGFNVSGNRLRGPIPVGLDNFVYKNGLLGNAELCGSGDLSVGSCSSSHKLSSRLLTTVLTPLLLLTVVSFCVVSLFYFTNFCLRKPTASPTWKLTSFHAFLGFDESHIIDRLTKKNLIGSGATGEVYKVVLPNRQEVAVKKIQNIIPPSRLKGNGQHNDKELDVEVDTLGLIRHDNILKLLCCISSEEADFKLLVYDYMPNGSLYDRLHHPQSPEMRLQWPIRYQIALGAARGLSYMHHDCSPPILHRDVKSSNILLDSDFHPKIADFGLCRQLQNLGDSYAVSGYVGSHGYIAPEYGDRLKVSSKSDVYSFGVVLLELVSGRKATGEFELMEGVDMVGWIRSSITRNGGVQGVVDGRIGVEMYMEEIVEVLRVGLSCTNMSPKERPSMRKVVGMVEMCKRNASPQSWKGGVVLDVNSPITPHWESEHEEI